MEPEQKPDNTSSDQDSNTLESSNVGESLESTTPSPGDSFSSSEDGPSNTSSPVPPSEPSDKPKKRRLKSLWQRLNIYLLLFVLLLVAAGIVVTVAILKNNKQTADTINGQTLSEQALKQLANSGSTVGDAKQVLNIQSNAIFDGTVLMRKDLEVAGTIKVGGSLSLPGISVSGASVFDQLQAKKLSIAGDTSINGQLTVQKGLSVNGSGAFKGPITTPQLTAGTLSLSGDLVLNHHVVAGGPIPGRTNGGALGAGGTSSVSGSDTAGTVSIHTGGNPAAGCFVTVNFVQHFATTPHVVITPIGSVAGSLQYYVNRSTSNFSICSDNSASGGKSFSFDYIIFD